MLKSLSLLPALWLLLLNSPCHVQTYTCPSYESIRQPSVGPDFDMKRDLAGEWHVLATTEPTVPNFCKTCGWLNFSFWTTAYEYKATIMCGGKNVSPVVHYTYLIPIPH